MYIILCMFHVTCLLCYSIVIYGNPNTCCGYMHVAKSLSAMQIYVNMYIDTYATWRFYTSWKFYTFEQINYSVFQKPRNLNLACLECSFYTSEPHQLMILELSAHKFPLLSSKEWFTSIRIALIKDFAHIISFR